MNSKNNLSSLGNSKRRSKSLPEVVGATKLIDKFQVFADFVDRFEQSINEMRRNNDFPTKAKLSAKDYVDFPSFTGL